MTGDLVKLRASCVYGVILVAGSLQPLGGRSPEPRARTGAFGDKLAVFAHTEAGTGGFVRFPEGKCHFTGVVGVNYSDSWTTLPRWLGHFTPEMGVFTPSRSRN